MTVTSETKKRSRFVIEQRNEPYRITDGNLAILALLQRYRYLPTAYIHALVGGGETHTKTILTKLRHEAGLIDARWAGHNALYQQAVYFLTRKGEDYLKGRGLYFHREKTGAEFHHELMVCLTRASFELGAKEHGLELLGAQDILNDLDCPVRTRHLKQPFVMPVEFEYQHQKQKHQVKTTVEPDGEFFALSKRVDDGRVLFYFPGFEADRRTEPLEPEDYDRPSIKKKFLAYRQLARERAYQDRFGIESFVVPFITINEAHMHALMRVLENVTNGKGSTLFIFKAIPNFAAFDKFPKPGGFMLSEPWKRVGHPDFNILDELR